MIIGLGIDLTEVSRIDEAWQRHDGKFLTRIFTAAEVEWCKGQNQPAIHLAGRFAAKEACAKALGCGVGGQAGWLDMEVSRDASGKPTMKLSGAAKESAERLGVKTAFVSITHTADHAAAVVVLEG